MRTLASSAHRTGKGKHYANRVHLCAMPRCVWLCSIFAACVNQTDKSTARVRVARGWCAMRWGEAFNQPRSSIEAISAERWKRFVPTQGISIIER
jgi:hypothetical protein